MLHLLKSEEVYIKRKILTIKTPQINSSKIQLEEKEKKKREIICTEGFD